MTNHRQALMGTIAALALVGAPAAQAASRHAPPHAVAAKRTSRIAFHDAMRKLWEDHITWTRLAIVSFAGGLPDLAATEQRLLRNQQDIGDAIEPYYGAAAGSRLTRLLREHILGAVDVLVAAKAGDQARLQRATAAWYANANRIADFLQAANPRNWPRREMRSMMKTHLDETLREATDRLTGSFAADIRDYDAVHRHILAMADELSAGIMRQFPRRFR